MLSRLTLLFLIFSLQAHAVRTVFVPLNIFDPNFHIYYIEVKNTGTLAQNVTIDVIASSRLKIDPQALLPVYQTTNLTTITSKTDTSVGSWCQKYGGVWCYCPITAPLPTPRGSSYSRTACGATSITCATAQKCSTATNLAPGALAHAQFSIANSGTSGLNPVYLYAKITVQETTGQLEGTVMIQSQLNPPITTMVGYWEHGAFKINNGWPF